MSKRSYLFVILILTAGTFVGVTATNLWLNPYGLFEWPRHTSTARAMRTHGVLFKAQLLEHVNPDAIIFGNSRAETGFSATPAVTGYARGVNAALSGSTFPEMLRMYRHALLSHSPKLVVFVLDPGSFGGISVRPAFDQLGIGRPLSPLESWWRRVAFHTHWRVLQTELVSRFFSAPEGDEAIDRWDSYGTRSEQSIRGEIRGHGGSRAVSLYWEQQLSRPPANVVEGVRQNLDSYAAVLADACSRGIKVITLIAPLHQRLLKQWSHSYGENFLAGWLFSLQQANESVSGECRDMPPSLWSGLESASDSVTNEPLAAEGKTTEMQHYWETSHFRRHIGDDLLSQVLLAKPPQWLQVRRIGSRDDQTTTAASYVHSDRNALAQQESSKVTK